MRHLRWPRRTAPSRLVLLPCAVLAILGSALPTGAVPPAVGAVRPNVVLIMTDDMNDDDLQWMPLTRSLIRKTGTDVTDFLAPHPLCCPARAMVLTGEYAQNNGVHDNDGPYDQRNLVDPGNNVGRWLQDAGYRTAIVGKFLNDFGQRTSTSLPGWDIFNITTACIFCSYGATYWDNGRQTTSSQYTTYYVRDRTLDYIKRFSRRGEPFFIWANPIAPHDMKPHLQRRVRDPIPAPRDLYTLTDVPLPSASKPSFNEADVSDKPAEYQVDAKTRRDMAEEFHRRIESLQAVDRMVRSVVEALAAAGQLDNTVIIFTSDNGYLLGEHRLDGKNFPYEEDLQVPLLMTGPGIPVGRRVHETMNLVDLPATIADITGAVPERTQDGRSMLPVITGSEPGYDSTLIQAGSGDAEWSWRGVRDKQWTYVAHTSGEHEVYDRLTDPFELNNVYGSDPALEEQLQARLDELETCSGAACFTP